jgi:PAS domain S-box-containing protein
MRLQTKLIVINVFLFLIAISFIGILLFSNSRTNIESQVINQLESISQLTENHINTFLNEQENKLRLVATQSKLTNEELTYMANSDSVFYDMFVINSSGYVTSSSNPERIGLYRGDRDYFVNARNQTHVSNIYFALVPKKYSVSVSTPFHDGVLVGAISLDVFDRLVSDKTGLGESGETLMAFIDENDNVVYFTTRKFSEKKIEILTKEQAMGRPISFALEGKEEVFLNTKDYRNVEVLASTNYINLTGMGMVTKIDTSEAFSKIKALQRMTIYLVVVILLVMSFAIYIASSKISREINDISSNIVRITKGDLNIQLKKSSLTEVQTLIDSLNRILASMKLAILRTGISKGELGIGEAVKAKEEAEDRFKILYESSADAIMTIEPPSWKFTAGNPATLKMFNVKDEEELQTLGPWDVSPKKQPNGKLSSDEAKKQIMKAMKEGKAYFEWTHRRYKGENFPATVLLSRFKLNGEDVLQATVRDLTLEKKERAK